MIYFSIDTCVWIYLGQEIYKPVLLDALIKLIDENEIKLLLPEQVKKEWDKHKSNKVIKGRISSIQDRFKNLKELYPLLTEDEVTQVSKISQNASKRDSDIEKFARTNCDKIDDLFKNKAVFIETNQLDINKASDAALEKKAPMLHQNNFADSIILFSTLRYCFEESIEKIIFVSENKDDFSDPKNKNVIHPDLTEIMNNHNCLFYNNIGKALNEIQVNIIDKETVIKIEENREIKCYNCPGSMSIGHWRMSRYGGGLSWHYTCPSCNASFDTADYYD